MQGNHAASVVCSDSCVYCGCQANRLISLTPTGEAPASSSLYLPTQFPSSRGISDHF